MSKERTPYIDIDQLQRELSVEQVAQFYGVSLPEGFASGGEQRICCPCNDCEGSTDSKSVSINTSDDFKPWKCHRENYGCGAQGRLAMLAYCFKHGAMPPGGKLKGSHFTEIRDDLASVRDGVPCPAPADVIDARSNSIQTEIKQQVAETIGKEANIPLAESEHEAARSVVKYEDDLVLNLAEMSPPASKYARQHPVLLSEELSRELGTGYMPGNAKSSLRHHWVFPVKNRQGQLLALTGRNVQYETKHEEWVAGGRQGREPNKYRFPSEKFFRKRLELAGQEWLDDERFESSLQQHGLILVEGFTDRYRLQMMNGLALGIMSNRATDEQVELAIEYAQEKAGGRIGLMHDADSPGDEGAKETLWRFQEAGLDAYLLWSRKKFGGLYADRQPESITDEEWNQITEKTKR